ncbi:MAG: ATP-binding protein [Elusimicrobiota bacterium]
MTRIFSIREILEHRVIHRVNSVGCRIIHSDISNCIKEQNCSKIEDIFMVATEPRIKFISVVNKKNDIIEYSTQDKLVNKLNPYYNTENIRKEKRDVYVESFPIKGTNKNEYYLQIGFLLDELRSDFMDVVRNNLFISFIGLFLIIIVAWYISGILLKPLLGMKDVAYNISKGNFSARVDIKSEDLIGDLGRTLNSMAQEIQDLTNNMEQKINEKTKELEKSNKRLKELDKLKSDFVSMVSHELRTPLTSIIGYAKTLMNLNLPDQERKESLKIIEQEGKRLSNLIEEYLDITKIEAGRFEIEVNPVDIKKVIRDVMDTAKFSEEKIELKISEGLPLIMGDKKRLERVLRNILDNAVKYSPPNEKVKISVHQDGNQVVVSVKDRGPGVSEQELDKIFDKFYRIDSKKNKETGGSGLGLAIAKGIIEAHNGKIWVENRIEGGAEFAFSIPTE